MPGGYVPKEQGYWAGSVEPNFKIDVHPYDKNRVVLWRREGWWIFTGWELIGSFDTVIEAQAYYEKIKNLPVYLP